MARPQAPCKNCGERQDYCHASCAAYAEYRAICDRYNQTVQENRGKDNAVISAVILGRHRMMGPRRGGRKK